MQLGKRDPIFLPVLRPQQQTACSYAANPAGSMVRVTLSDGWGASSVGRALRSQRRGRGFNSPALHQIYFTGNQPVHPSIVSCHLSRQIAINSVCRGIQKICAPIKSRRLPRALSMLCCVTVANSSKTVLNRLTRSGTKSATWPVFGEERSSICWSRCCSPSSLASSAFVLTVTILCLRASMRWAISCSTCVSWAWCSEGKDLCNLQDAESEKRIEESLAVVRLYL